MEPMPVAASPEQSNASTSGGSVAASLVQDARRTSIEGSQSSVASLRGPKASLSRMNSQTGVKAPGLPPFSSHRNSHRLVLAGHLGVSTSSAVFLAILDSETIVDTKTILGTETILDNETILDSETILDRLDPFSVDQPKATPASALPTFRPSSETRRSEEPVTSGSLFPSRPLPNLHAAAPAQAMSPVSKPSVGDMTGQLTGTLSLKIHVVTFNMANKNPSQ
eukprot:gene3564-13640_t